MSQKRYDANLPKNLTYRKNDKAFYWRNPLTKKEIALGQISRRDAIAQAIEANNFIAQKYTPVALIEILKGTDSLTVTKWIERYEILLQRRNLSANTYKIRGNQLATIREKMGGMLLAEVTTKHVATFLETWIEGGKNTMAGAMRSVLSDMFREAVVEGHITQNPVEPTRAPKIEVARDRLRLDVYRKIREAAEKLPAWFPLAMDLALITGQRREDIANMKFSDIVDGRLHVTQIKTGMKIAFPLSLTLEVPGLRLGTVIDRCRLVSRTDFMISAGIRKNSPTGNIHPDGLTKKFVKARKITGVKFSDNPPTFHEIRSLAGRLYKDERGEEFAQKLLGHTSENTTKLYLDERDNKAYVML
ncbi:tyrosine-type recombinase/integrase [Salmonella enterica]|uniref:tyrosine-type recombinase/integrase n=1 Tax=Salmonella enterica TaxID=28901 RepID=UPI0009AE4864|nr:tyrosine-type recombinase/integrase [Salmonella enterica]EBP3773731.1 tyrosine-type recombinase/integrase [Salmonella enterica subsp. arizonae]EBP9941868.1 tyrosine-type recombinase/integrase [Salmonella enterica subsp. enterica]EDX7515506.1 tyrosine-type recombinase/integrase [Salmonella enterica subsp. enterica serovar Miami]EEJ5160993.1 tyrosine-type recombinase/integrase [Salmonella enterica subsp. enterica serovar Sandiego]EAW8700131.1 integrase [Salmonella enterica]